MKTTILWGLIGLNALLLAAFMSRYVRENTAEAQAARGPGEYMIIPGAVTGLSSEVIYIIDTLNGQLGAVAFDVNGNRLDAMPTNDLNRVFQVGVAPPGNVAPGVPGSVPPGTPRRY